jgi:hypothetical protein
MLMKSTSKRKRTKEELEEVKQEEDAMRTDTPGLPSGREASQAGARRDACNDLRGSDLGIDAGR